VQGASGGGIAAVIGGVLKGADRSVTICTL